MLVANRDPFHPGTHDTSYPESGLHAVRAPRFARTMTAVQMFGTLLAIPLGIGSAYTMYRANFSPETTCQSLRTNIVSMLDKSVDARSRHMLVRRDVMAFEKNCGSVDPDATVAFKALLASDGAAAPRVEVKAPEQKSKDVARRVEAQPKPESETRKAAAAEPKQHEALTDTAWLAAVRGALTPPDAEAATPPRTPETVAGTPAGAAPSPPIQEVRPKTELRKSLPSAASVSGPPVAAETLPPPATIATVPAPQADVDHPVPPASIPQPVETQRDQSRLGSLIGQIPFVGQIIEK